MRASWCDIAPWLFCTRRGEGYFDEQSGQAAGELGNYWVTRMRESQNASIAGSQR